MKKRTSESEEAYSEKKLSELQFSDERNAELTNQKKHQQKLP